MCDIVPCGGVLTDCNQHVTPLASSSPTVKHENMKGHFWSQCLVCPFWATVVQHGGLRVSGTDPSEDVKGSSYGNENAMMPSFRCLYTHENTTDLHERHEHERSSCL